MHLEILRNDLDPEQVMDVTLKGRIMGGKCNLDGGNYDGTFFRCPHNTNKKATPPSGKTQTNNRLTGHSRGG